MIDLPHLQSKLVPCVIREYRHDDREACLEVYRSNTPDLLPGEVLPHFEKFLETGTSYVLVVESEGLIVGTGSLALQGDSNHALLLYGVIHREHHGKGFGSSLLAARLSLVDSDAWPVGVLMETSPLTGNFFAQYGFSLLQTHKGYGLGAEGGKVPFGQWRLMLQKTDVEALRTALAASGVEIQLDEVSLFAGDGDPGQEAETDLQPNDVS